MKICILLGIMINVATAVVVLFTGSGICGIFNSDTAVVAECLKVMRITFPFYWLYVIMEVLADTIRGAGKATEPMMIIMLNICLFRTILLFVIMSFYHNIHGIAIVYPVSWATTVICMLIYYRSGRWKLRTNA